MFSHPSRCVAALAISGCLVAACGDDDGGDSSGGSDADRIRATVTAYANATDKDGCALVTQRFLEEQTGEQGAAAVKACEQSFGGEAADDLQLGQPEIQGDRATVRATGDGETGNFTLVRAGDDWKIDGVAADESSSDEGAATTTQSGAATTPAAPTKAQFVTRVNAICQASEAEYDRVKKLAQSSDVAEIKRGLAEFAKLESGITGRIAALTPPAGDAGKVGELTSALTDVATSASAAAKADVAGLAAEAQQSLAKALAFESKARAYGLELVGGCRPTA